MLNLNAISGSVIQDVNPDVEAKLYRYKSYTTTSSGVRVPVYYPAETAMIQCQGVLSAPELAQIAGLNIQGVKQGVYLNGNWQGVVRADKTGGDKLEYADFPGAPVKNWLIVHILESFSDFTKVVVAQQV
ncbi:MAG: hypothetical protein HGA87_00315 [Desulfobulbaceae bacterium]|nr:hypothetical protein [Desulfobulbaceae bacterium]